MERLWSPLGSIIINVVNDVDASIEIGVGRVYSVSRMIEETVVESVVSRSPRIIRHVWPAALCFQESSSLNATIQELISLSKK